MNKKGKVVIMVVSAMVMMLIAIVVILVATKQITLGNGRNSFSYNEPKATSEVDSEKGEVVIGVEAELQVDGTPIDTEPKDTVLSFQVRINSDLKNDTTITNTAKVNDIETTVTNTVVRPIANVSKEIVAINDDGTETEVLTQVVENDHKVVTKVMNELPATGGDGTMMFIVAGMMIMIVGATVAITRCKMRMKE